MGEAVGEEGGVFKKWIKMLRAKSEGCFIVIHSRSSPFLFCLTGNERLFTLGNTVAAYFILFYFIIIIIYLFIFGKTIWFCVLSLSRKWIYFHIVSAKLSPAVALIHSLTVGKSWPVLGLRRQIPTCDRGRQIPMYQVTQVPTSTSCPL